ncbi:MAG TPA: LysM peptidoglycan-binding domain-containing protein [Candidatus Eisenbacteria bacterium]|nr:LysM peptidoglycan-binding domain-containing protein [Candidatus Eisenbacteria bacterium]
MADRLKYFLLGVLFLVVAGVIAYDRWNPASETQEVAGDSDGDSGTDVDLTVNPPRTEPPAIANEGQPRQTPPAQDPVPAPDNVKPTPPPERRPEPVEQKPAPKPEPKPEPDRTHVIRKGETLEAIAIKYYGTRDGIQWIVNANGLANANRIYASQKLVIPARKEITKQKGSGDAAPAKTAEKSPSRYTVKAGDGDLYAICRRIYGSATGARVSQIMDMNHLWSADVKTGTVLILPKP